MLDKDMNVKISDFGFAVQLVENEKLSDLCGTPGYLAPETLACSMYENLPGYGMEVDMWACGVILFTLYDALIRMKNKQQKRIFLIFIFFYFRLSGSPPFWHRRQVIMLRMIMEANYSFSSPEWDEISEKAKDLVSATKQIFFLLLRFYNLTHLLLDHQLNRFEICS